MAWSLDLIVDVGPAKGHKAHVLSAICCFSKFCVLTLLHNKSSQGVATAFHQRVASVFGYPQDIRTDNGGEFRGVVR